MPATDHPPQTCLLNWGRLNAFPLNYLSGRLYGSIGGVPLDPKTQSILIDSLSISDRLNEDPNTLIATVRGIKPTEGQGIRLTLGTQNANAPLFAGTILRVTQVWAADNPKFLLFHVEATDPTWRLNEILVTARYRAQSASAIAADLLARFAPAGYLASIELGLPTLDEITFTNTKLMDALVQLASRIGGYTFCDYTSTVRVWRTIEATIPPVPLTATHPSLAKVQYTRDLTQIVTRAIVQGGGANALARILPGSTELPVEDASWYNVSGGLVTSGPQRLSYTGTRAGGGGSLVGSGSAPSSALALTPSSGGAVTVGDHYYVYTWVSATGETLASPMTAIAISGTALAGVAPSVAVGPGTGLAPATYTYGVSHVFPAGETAVSGPVTANCTNWSALTTTQAPTGVPAGQGNFAGARDNLNFRILYRSTTALSPGTLGPVGPTVTLPDVLYNAGVDLTVYPVTDPGGAVYADVQFYNSSISYGWATLRTIPVPVAPAPAVVLQLRTETIKGGPHTGDTSGLPRAAVTVTVNDGGAGVTARRVYRTKGNGSQLYLLRQVSGSAATSFVDTTADSALVTVPPAGLGPLQAVTVSGLALGPKGAGGGPPTTARKLYRTYANSGAWGRLATIADNTTTTYVDTLADASLTAVTLPVTDTSGLLADGGQVLAGTTTIPVSGTGPFPTAGGWVLSGNNRIHYASVSGGTLAGVPATGEGAIQNTIPYGTPITLAPCLTGIPAAGTGAIVWTILAGDPVDLVVVVDDLAAQAALQTLLGGSATGIREALIQDGRIGIPEATNRGTALLQLQSRVLESLRHRSRDPNTVSGALVSINLPAPTAIVGTFRVQDVTISSFNPAAGIMPAYDAASSSSRYTLEDLLRSLARTDPPPTTGETS